MKGNEIRRVYVYKRSSTAILWKSCGWFPGRAAKSPQKFLAINLPRAVKAAFEINVDSATGWHIDTHKFQEKNIQVNKVLFVTL